VESRLSSTELVCLWRKGDEKAATELYRRYIQRLFHTVDLNLPQKMKVRLDADDICQSVFRSMFRRMRHGEFTFQDDADFWKLLVTVALNKLRNQVRNASAGKRDVQRETPLDATSEPNPFLLNRLSRGPSVEEAAQFREIMERICEQLTSVERELLQLRAEGYLQQEIAERLNLSERTIRRMNERLRERVLDAF
jgi:RNA polymerase sigma-70 factor (ECF subfamily)